MLPGRKEKTLVGAKEEDAKDRGFGEVSFFCILKLSLCLISPQTSFCTITTREQSAAAGNFRHLWRHKDQRNKGGAPVELNDHLLYMYEV